MFIDIRNILKKKHRTACLEYLTWLILSFLYDQQTYYCQYRNIDNKYWLVLLDKFVTGTGFSQTTVLFPCQHHSTNARYHWHYAILEIVTLSKKNTAKGSFKSHCFYCARWKCLGGRGLPSHCSANLYTMKRHTPPRADLLLPPP